MAEDHQSLAHFIKNVHSSLRKTSSELGVDKAWNEHCRNQDILIKYADCMQRLATTHWETNCASASNEAFSRIEWAASFCNNYFNTEQYEKYRAKEQDIASKVDLILESKEEFLKPLKLIDVGSCYNPFKRFTYFDVLAIDLCPANNSVYQCDFLSVPVGTCTLTEGTKLTQIQQQSFEIVTFCFLLEYIPSSDLRISACKKAYALLKPGGLLIINTPDSKHVGANSKQMKCWRYTLAQIGFSRIKYEKFRHMHCMAFRRCLHKSIATRWAQLHKDSSMEFAIHIPQDFQNYESDNKIKDDHRVLPSVTDFQEMPFSVNLDLYE